MVTTMVTTVKEHRYTLKSIPKIMWILTTHPAPTRTTTTIVAWPCMQIMTGVLLKAIRLITRTHISARRILPKLGNLGIRSGEEAKEIPATITIPTTTTTTTASTAVTTAPITIIRLEEAETLADHGPKTM